MLRQIVGRQARNLALRHNRKKAKPPVKAFLRGAKSVKQKAIAIEV